LSFSQLYFPELLQMEWVEWVCKRELVMFIGTGFHGLDAIFVVQPTVSKHLSK